MAKPNHIELPGCDPMPILYEDRAVIAIDKPRGWMLVPHSWQRTQRNLMAAMESSLRAGDFWATSRGLKFLKNVHRLDAETTGILLFAKSYGSLEVISELFETRKMTKTYLAVVVGIPQQKEWHCQLPLGPDAKRIGRQRVDTHAGKPAETYFRLLETRGGQSLVECRPITGRTHQIRIHLAESGLPIVGDELYGRIGNALSMGLRAVRLEFMNPFTRRPVDIRAPQDWFLKEFGFAPGTPAPAPAAAGSGNSPAKPVVTEPKPVDKRPATSTSVRPPGKPRFQPHAPKRPGFDRESTKGRDRR